MPERVHQGWGWPSRNPVLLHEGWQDRFPDQMIGQYERLRRRGVDVALIIGPWTHVGVGTKGAGIVMTETLDWLAEHLAGTGRRQRLNDTQPRSDAGPTTFTYDPADPTPAVGGQIINPAAGGYRDNQKLEERADVLTFTSPSLSEPLEVIGNPAVEVVHQTDNPHADLFVRVCEVRKNGRSINLSDGFQRLDPAKSSGTISIRLEAMAHRFTPGVRIRLQISGGAHPRYARNLGTSQDPATSSSLASSRRKIFHGAGGFSRLSLPCPI